MAQPEMGTFVPQFTAGVSTSVPTSPNPQVKIRFDDMVVSL
jgi:hypothetical protein